MGEAVLDLLTLGGGIRNFKSRDNLLEHTVKLVPRKGGSLKEAKYVGNWIFDIWIFDINWFMVNVVDFC